MNKNYYHISIEHDFEADSDEEAVKKCRAILKSAGIPADDCTLKCFTRGTIGDYGTYIDLED